MATTCIARGSKYSKLELIGSYDFESRIAKQDWLDYAEEAFDKRWPDLIWYPYISEIWAEVGEETDFNEDEFDKMLSDAFEAWRDEANDGEIDLYYVKTNGYNMLYAEMGKRGFWANTEIEESEDEAQSLVDGTLESGADYTVSTWDKLDSQVDLNDRNNEVIAEGRF